MNKNNQVQTINKEKVTLSDMLESDNSHLPTNKERLQNILKLTSIFYALVFVFSLYLNNYNFLLFFSFPLIISVAAMLVLIRFNQRFSRQFDWYYKKVNMDEYK